MQPYHQNILDLGDGNAEPLQSVIANLATISSIDDIDVEKLYSKAVREGDTSAYCLCCYLLFDKGADSLPKYGQTLHSDFYNRLQVDNNKEQKTVVINSQKMYIWETTGLVWGEEGFCGNFFGATMKPKHPSGGSSGSPIYDGNIVYGILHNGGDDFCGFYSSVHALKLLHQFQSK